MTVKSIAEAPGQMACEAIPPLCTWLSMITGSQSMATLVLGGAIWAAGILTVAHFVGGGKRRR